MRRRFNLTERVAIYLRAGGRCQRCGQVLGRGWHADHVVPFTGGGPTTLSNGQALCPECNNKKGAQMDADNFELRPKQRDIAPLAVERARRGDRTPVLVLLAPGFGKEWGWQHTATELMRQNLITSSMTFTPRRNLCAQAETGWKKRRKRYASPRPEGFPFTAGNQTPLYREPAFGYVSTYQALTTNPRPHEAVARMHSGRLLIVCDEAAGLGGTGVGEDDDQTATLAAARIEDLAPHAACILLLTGAPYRGDGKRLILCEDRYYHHEDGTYHLSADIEGTYTEGVEHGFLRPITVLYADAEGRVDDQLVTVTDNPWLVTPMLRDKRVYGPMIAKTLDHLHAVRGLHPQLMAGIACIDGGHAREAMELTKQLGPKLRVDIALAEDGKTSQRNLQAARDGGLDVLVFVRQAFIGFDCPAMSVFCVLSNVREPSYLTQLVGRSLRVADGIPVGEQTAHIVTLNDRAAVDFFEAMKTDSQRGIELREQREVVADNGERTTVRQVEDAGVTGWHFEDTEGDVDGAEEALRFMRGEPIPDTPTAVRAVASIIAKVRNPQAEPEPEAPPQTEEEEKQALKIATKTNLRGIAGKWMNVRGGRMDDHMRALYREVAERSGVWASDGRTSLHEERRRVETSIAMCEEYGVRVRAH